jgi:hypothetical protein
MIFENGKTYSKAELAQLYNISGKTFRVWLVPIIKAHKTVFPPNFHRKKILTVKQVSIIVEHLGQP